LEKTEFEKRLQNLNIPNLSQVEIKMVSNYLALNEKTEKLQVIHLKNYLHHINNVSSYTGHSIDSKTILLSILCARLLISESKFKKQCYEMANIDKGCIDPSGIRTVLIANGIISKYADFFIEELMKCVNCNLDELIARMKAEAALYYKSSHYSGLGTDKVNYQELLKTIFNELRPLQLIEVCRRFDKEGTGKIKLYHMLNILQHNYSIDDMFIAGLQYELTLLYPDEYIDYVKFLESYEGEVDKEDEKEKEKLYEGVLSRLQGYIVKNKINIKKAFEMFDLDEDEAVSREEFARVMKWIDFDLTFEEIDILYQFAFNEHELIKYKEFTELVMKYSSILTTFNKQQWMSAAKGISLNDQCKVILDNIDQLTFLLHKEYPSQLIPGEVFMNCLRNVNIGLSEEEIVMVTKYAIRGSKRLTNEQQMVILSGVELDLHKDLVNFPFFVQSLKQPLTTKHKEEVDRKVERHYMEKLKKIEKEKEKNKEMEVIAKVKQYFIKTGLSFYDYFFSEEGNFFQTKLQYFCLVGE